MVQDVFAELEWRGLIHQSSSDALRGLLASERFVAYCGFDPTAPSLTTAHLMQLLRLRRLQMAGHVPIALAGGGTGLIGDPSFKEEERPLLTKEEIDANVERIKAQLEKLLDFSSGSSQAILLNNADWLTTLGLTDFLRDVGKYFSVNMMIAKEAVRARLEDREQGISYTEFSYMLLQSYDYLHLFDNFGCRLQLGGSDQWGNIVAGVELVRRARGAEVYALTSPLIVRADGKKMSKSEGGAVWLDPEMTSPYAFYQHWLNTPDANAGEFLRYFTFLERDRIEELEAKIVSAAAAREAQKTLAFEMTSLLHGQLEAEKAVAASKALFSTDIRNLDEKTLLEVMQEAPASTLSKQGELELVEILVSTGLARSRGDARTQIEGGGIYVNNERVADIDRRLEPADLLHGRYVVLRRGKKTHHLLSLE